MNIVKNFHFLLALFWIKYLVFQCVAMFSLFKKPNLLNLWICWGTIILEQLCSIYVLKNSIKFWFFFSFCRVQSYLFKCPCLHSQTILKFFIYIFQMVNFKHLYSLPFYNKLWLAPILTVSSPYIFLPHLAYYSLGISLYFSSHMQDSCRSMIVTVWSLLNSVPSSSQLAM